MNYPYESRVAGDIPNKLNIFLIDVFEFLVNRKRALEYSHLCFKVDVGRVSEMYLVQNWKLFFPGIGLNFKV